jgi:hypothetical protein
MRSDVVQRYRFPLSVNVRPLPGGGASLFIAGSDGRSGAATSFPATADLDRLSDAAFAAARTGTEVARLNRLHADIAAAAQNLLPNSRLSRAAELLAREALGAMLVAASAATLVLFATVKLGAALIYCGAAACALDFVFGPGASRAAAASRGADRLMLLGGACLATAVAIWGLSGAIMSLWLPFAALLWYRGHGRGEAAILLRIGRIARRAGRPLAFCIEVGRVRFYGDPLRYWEVCYSDEHGRRAVYAPEHAADHDTVAAVMEALEPACCCSRREGGLVPETMRSAALAALADE